MTPLLIRTAIPKYTFRSPFLSSFRHSILSRPRDLRVAKVGIKNYAKAPQHVNRCYTTASMSDRATLLKVPPEDPNKSPIENVVEVTELSVLGPVSVVPLYPCGMAIF